MSLTPSSPTLNAGDVSITLTASGDIHAIRAGGLLVNQFLPGPHDGMAAGVFLRRHTPDGVEVRAIMGSAPAVTACATAADRAVWTGRSLGIDHVVELTVDEANLWVWRVTLTAAEADRDAESLENVEYDVVVAQDMALSPPGTALSSEPYVCQYLAHRILGHPRGPVIASRQTMTASPNLPLVVSAIVEGASAYATDAMQIHTPRARLDAEPHGLANELVSGNYQYELSTPTLVSHRLRVQEGPATIHAYAAFQADAPGSLTEQTIHLDAWSAQAVAAAARDAQVEPIEVTVSPLRSAPLLAGRDLTDAELLSIAGVDRDHLRLPESDADGRLMSFFTGDDAHVVRGAKDLLVERSHGHVLKAGDDVAPHDDILSTTAYAPGIFASHVVVGNTSANRLVTVQRHHLNLLRTSGVRVFVGAADGPDGDTDLHQLGVPSVLTFDLGGAHWVYLTEFGRIDVRTVAAATENRIDVLVEAEQALRIVATIDIEPGDDVPLWTAEPLDATTLRLTPADGSDVAGRYPDLTYLLGSTAPITPSDPLLVSRTTGHRLELTFTASLTDPGRATDLLTGRRATGIDIARELTGHRATLRGLALGLRLGGTSTVAADELDALVPWYVHDALVHFLVPHGLEQYSGAAWGTRDVCQGPFELHLAFGRFDVARQILLTTFAHQNPAGDFPQWFMFDAYEDRYSDDAHGDVPVWPLFALGQYLRATGDHGLLDAQVPFWDDAARRSGVDPVPVSVHVDRLLDYLDDHRLPGTALPAYGHGDWDDTLQPADPAMRTTLASTWTSALLVQAARETATGLVASSALTDRLQALADRLQVLADAVAGDLRSRMLIDGVLAGYLSRSPDGSEQPVIHPSDDRTGITYRLIPMTRSIIAGILDPDEASAHEDIVRDHLHFPDGVRLMDRPAAFDDGIPHVFLRAEQAANVGREIGLMYTHAHIRWVEALAALGRGDTLAELVRISPLGINARLAHAMPRQRNVYYSSSDAAFDDRYAFAAGFDLLRTGQVGVKGGWRVYSSGPGIFLRQLIQGVLGITVRHNSVIFDPVLPLDADGLTVDIELAGQHRQLRYSVRPDVQQVDVRSGSGATLRPLTGRQTSNRYRATGVEIALDTLSDYTELTVVVPPGR